jgi:hypothetical protein
MQDEAAKPNIQAPARVPIPSGRGYRIESPPEGAMITPELANELRTVLERFAAEAGATEQSPITVVFKPGVVGHHKVGRAADIYGVAGAGLDLWKRRWDEAQQQAASAPDPAASRAIDERERRRNRGGRLYKALQLYGRWSQPYGYPIQLFGPWTRTEGPWKYITNRLLHAHRDHIHVAK